MCDSALNALQLFSIFKFNYIAGRLRKIRALFLLVLFSSSFFLSSNELCWFYCSTFFFLSFHRWIRRWHFSPLFRCGKHNFTIYSIRLGLRQPTNKRTDEQPQKGQNANKQSVNNFSGECGMNAKDLHVRAVLFGWFECSDFMWMASTMRRCNSNVCVCVEWKINC